MMVHNFIKNVLVQKKIIQQDLCFVFIGVLLGIAIRTGSPLSLYLAEPVWKQLAGMNLTIADLSEVSICVCVCALQLL